MAISTTWLFKMGSEILPQKFDSHKVVNILGVVEESVLELLCREHLLHIILHSSDIVLDVELGVHSWIQSGIASDVPCTSCCGSVRAQPGTNGSFDVMVEVQIRAAWRTRARQFLDPSAVLPVLIGLGFIIV